MVRKNKYHGYYADFCVCPGKVALVGMRTTDGDETDSYPVDVYNVNMELIGQAGNKDAYLAVWNSDTYNREVGFLKGSYGPFLFSLLLNKGQDSPGYVLGNPIGFEGGDGEFDWNEFDNSEFN